MHACKCEEFVESGGVIIFNISLIIPTKNAGENFETVLKGFKIALSIYNYEIIIVDSGSTDKTLEIAHKHKVKILKIPPQKFTHGYARNYGASIAFGDYLIFCNQDVFPVNKYWLTNLIKPLGKEGVVASYSCQISPPENPSSERIFLQYHYPSKNKIISTKSLKNMGVEKIILFSTVSAAILKDTWEMYRFNENIIMSEDQEFAYRIIFSGYKIAYVSNSKVYHSNTYTFSSAFRRYFDSGWSNAQIPNYASYSFLDVFIYIIKMIKIIIKDKWTLPSEKINNIIIFICKVLGFSMGKMAPYLPKFIVYKISFTKHIINK